MQKKVTMAVRVTARIKHMLQQHAENEGTSCSYIIETLITKWVLEGDKYVDTLFNKVKLCTQGRTYIQDCSCLVTFKLPEEVCCAFKEKYEKDGLSQSEVCRGLLGYYFEKRIPCPLERLYSKQEYFKDSVRIKVNNDIYEQFVLWCEDKGVTCRGILMKLAILRSKEEQNLAGIYIVEENCYVVQSGSVYLITEYVHENGGYYKKVINKIGLSMKVKLPMCTWKYVRERSYSIFQVLMIRCLCGAEDSHV